jgi:hypothetical protein
MEYDEFVKGFIDVKKILEQVSEEQIFALVFNFIPEIGEYYTSPFREDENEGCFFEYGEKGDLRFVDYGNYSIIKGVKMVNIGCFDAVKIYYNLSNFYQVLKFIQFNIKKIQKLDYTKIHNNNVNIKKREKFSITITTKPFEIKDKNFWSKYLISSSNLEEDKVYSVNSFFLESSKGYVNNKPKELCYAYTDFKDSLKIYLPERKKKRFITNCNENDIGGWNLLNKTGKQLVITKSYKDYRVLKNLKINVIWFQNEGQIPSLEILYSLIYRFTEIIIFYDNDKVGIEASIRIVETFNNLIPKISRNIYLPDLSIKDPSDLVKETKTDKKLIEFLKEKKIILFN